jgi:PPOX class probable F420-dependent enzyme
MIADEQTAFLAAQRVGRLATADAQGNPHVVPVCFAIENATQGNATLYITVDQKPKRTADRPLARLRNISVNPSVAFIADHYDEDWSQLGWVMLRGHAEILVDGPEHDRAQALLRERYPQYRAMQLSELPVIALRIRRATSWGNLVPTVAGSGALPDPAQINARNRTVRR